MLRAIDERLTSNLLRKPAAGHLLRKSRFDERYAYACVDPRHARRIKAQALLPVAMPST